MSARNYKNNAPATTLVSSITSSDINITVNDSAGFPSVPFTATLDRLTATEEVILVTATTGNTFTVTRGFDGTIAQDHSATTKFEHVAVALDYREANTHIQASTGVHGVTGSVVGTEGTQTLTGKTVVDAQVTGDAAAYALRVAASAAGGLIDATTSGTSQFRVARDGTASSGAVNVTNSVISAAGTTQGVYLTKDGQAVITAAVGGAGPELTVTPPDAAAGVKSVGVGDGFQVDRDGKTTTASLLVSGGATVSGATTLTGAATLADTLTVTGKTYATDLAVSGRADVVGDLTAGGDASITGSLGVGTLVSGGATFNGSATFVQAPTGPGLPRTVAAKAGVSGVVAPNSGAAVGGSAAVTFLADHVYEVVGQFSYSIGNAVYGDMALSVALDSATLGNAWSKRYTDVGTNDGHAETVAFSFGFTGQSGSHAVRLNFNGSTYGGNTAVACQYFKVMDLGLASDLGW